MQHFFVRRRTNGTQEKYLVDPQRLVHFDKRMQSAGVPTQNLVPCSRTSAGVGSPGCGPLARR